MALREMHGGSMIGGSTIWGVMKTAATRIPWLRVIENIPAVVDIVGRAKARLRESAAQGNADERFRLLEEENQKLGKALLQTTEQLQELSRSLEVLAARQKMLYIATAVSLLLALSFLLLWLSS